MVKKGDHQNLYSGLNVSYSSGCTFLYPVTLSQTAGVLEIYH